MGNFSFNNIFSDVAISGLTESVLPPLILNMSITGGVVILFVLLARLLLKKAPKVFSYALWSVVLFRLLCPVSITTDFSLMKLLDTPAVENTQHTTAMEYIPYDVVHTRELEVQLPVPPAVNEAVNEVLPQEHAALGADPLKGDFAIGSMIWMLGIGIMAIYSMVSYILLRQKLIGAVLLRKNIYLADGIATPFVMGIIFPKIYLPSALSEQEQRYIILHEQHHIHRGDHIIKVLAFLALCIHWFNPLVWVAFVQSSKDMEMSCDEAVVKKLGESIRTDYSASLLNLATGRRMIAGTPLAFGEGDTKSRIKNMLNWKQAKPIVVFLAALAVMIALIVCGTNATKNDSWIKGTQHATAVELECNLETPIRSYAIYEDVYENGELISSESIIFDGFKEEGGATPRKATMTLNAQPVSTEEGGFAGEISFYYEAAGTAHMERKLPKDHYTGVVHVVAEIGNGISGKQKIETEDSVIILTVLLSTEPDGKVVVENKEHTLMESNDTVVIYRLVTSVEGIDQYLKQDDASDPDDTSDRAEGASDAVVTNSIAEDISYYLELAAGTEFQDMSQERQADILAEYKDLLDNYTLVARESKDGKAAYIVGHSNVEPAQSSLYGMYAIELSAGEEEVFQFLYGEEDAETVEAVMAENKTDFPDSVGYRIENSRILCPANGDSLLIQPKDIELLMDVPYTRCLYTPNGREYIVDAVSRGIDVCGKTDTYLYVYRMSEQFGEISERIALTEAEAKAILEEKLVNIPKGFGFAATLHMNGQSDYYGEHSGVPQTILDLAIEKCDYRFEDPGMIEDTILEARLDCDWLENPIFAKEDDITRLREILKNAEFGYVGGCGYGAKLSLTFANGEKMTVFKGCDGCDTIVFGSYSGYFLGDKENTEFWEIFGLDPESKLPEETGAEEKEMVDTTEISSIVVINGNTGERKTLTEEDYNAYKDLIKLYWQLDFTAEYKQNTRVGYQYSMILQDADGNKMQSITPYKDGVTVDGTFYQYDNTENKADNGAEASLRLMEYLESIFVMQ